MQILVQVLCSKGGSLREAIANDTRIDKFSLTVTSEKQPGRQPGWMKLHSAELQKSCLERIPFLIIQTL